jgi:Fur family peroxide stress response transcriptional regulator
LNDTFFREQLKEKGLKDTPQRFAKYEAIVSLKNHPSAENVFEYIKKIHLNI